ncbi:MAG: hypothetical protein A3J07_01800 [Candidatus Doudnabacteria bacterium RIFCSPLOWO2_02_FULL_49_13]|uniref:Uncharacterized protein n=1 Tax=Candidatus Doudnabacteria bacterium RIFCSPHIGHO2_12_FULL_48_16 TaxID=1817838 RepID=A0A1F5PL61_9BACT|nr:MAG: hypothetical protein A3B77_00915 [Candidatus Doudnabacteria bacterium RIFCSPHIGHO2_02_FULL_49_24]OGE88805.1 MAG: hypothetical protein A2760_01270 [Candidatus Doudnabacteria bacterium RIFCSPHIGHO2_01_FULL_50_67]OGE90673.1 MAG: hypothetical protein A3E29_00895 [Candidatus Doudnabacteria bacterium RIFCSPHIGHO2_12_FULL_48_16]OGE97004.1 MAG: hypothetical protein A2990_02920 [Candidatus Doudnabacteria bacterium RIFCSPLOWO2_01_FULL_49_40]OGF02538.1 MAG: hypothetical protein A3J07_01800 [Candid
MYDFSSQANLFIQAFIAIIIIGVFYNLWVTTRVYGGIIGRAVRFLGLGMLFVAVAVLERVLINFSIIANSPSLSLAQDSLSLLGLIMLGVGFSQLAAATKA